MAVKAGAGLARAKLEGVSQAYGGFNDVDHIPPRRPGRHRYCARVGATALAAASATDDPIFALIERHRFAAAVYAVTDPDTDPEGDELALAEDEDALEELLTTRPATLAGCVAVLRYVAGYEADHDVGLFDLSILRPTPRRSWRTSRTRSKLWRCDDTRATRRLRSRVDGPDRGRRAFCGGAGWWILQRVEGSLLTSRHVSAEIAQPDFVISTA